MTATVANFRPAPGNFPSSPGNSRPSAHARVTRAYTRAHTRVMGNYHSRPGRAGRHVMAGPTFTFGDQLALPSDSRSPSAVDRIRATARARYAAASTTTERYAAAYDYLRAAAAAARGAGFDPDPEVVELTRLTVAAADRITNALAGRVS